MEKRYRVLRFVASVFKIVAWIVLVLGVVSAIAAVVLGAMGTDVGRGLLDAVLTGVVGGILAGVALLISSVVYFLVLYAIGELIYVGLAIEENTRETAFYLRGESSLSPPPSLP